MKILLDNNVIDKETFDFTEKIIQKLILQYKFNKEDIETMITHLAMATQRTKSGETINALDNEIRAEVEAEKLYPEAVKILDDILSLSTVKYCENEKVFMTVHLINLLK